MPAMTVRAQTGPHSNCAGRLYAEGWCVCKEQVCVCVCVCAKKSLLCLVVREFASESWVWRTVYRLAFRHRG